ncbi:hypothetical protein M9H77_02279 [Catharanthus roseus]|uniref:Uncharacterized protein n=1 Tax=Catharanthus roseus TaxID=4058 RepID=A0ACC0C7Y2_CATRO|nr:hypothetical protein M9H77_02279 [Catharanthus roseus]
MNILLTANEYKYVMSDPCLDIGEESIKEDREAKKEGFGLSSAKFFGTCFTVSCAFKVISIPARTGRRRRGRGRTELFSSSSSSTSRSHASSSSSKYNPRMDFRTTSSSITNAYNKTKSVGRNWVEDAADDVDQGTDLPNFIGTCLFMCSVEERLQRERLRDLAVFERLDGNPRKSSANLAVKKFCRTISTREIRASSVRPLLVLEETLNHLFSLWASAEHPFDVVHEFLFDRTRSIRQDLSMQSISNDQVITMYEKMV